MKLNKSNYHSSQSARFRRQQTARFTIVLLPTSIKNFPETNGLISRGSAYSCVIWCHRHVQDSLGVPAKVGHFWTRWVLPQAELVFTESVRTQNLLVLLIPDEGAYLTLCIDSIDQFSCLDVPESHRLVVGSTTRRQQISLPWAPSQGLDCCLVTL